MTENKGRAGDAAANPCAQGRKDDMNIPISSMMTSPVLSVGMDDTVEAVEAFMNGQRLSWVPVREPNGVVVGVVSTTDLLQFHVRQKNPAKVSAWEICSYKPISVAVSTPVSTVAQLMLQSRTHHVLITDNDNAFGVVSSLDFVRSFAAQTIT